MLRFANIRGPRIFGISRRPTQDGGQQSSLFPRKLSRSNGLSCPPCSLWATRRQIGCNTTAKTTEAVRGAAPLRQHQIHLGGSLKSWHQSACWKRMSMFRHGPCLRIIRSLQNEPAAVWFFAQYLRSLPACPLARWSIGHPSQVAAVHVRVGCEPD